MLVPPAAANEVAAVDKCDRPPLLPSLFSHVSPVYCQLVCNRDAAPCAQLHEKARPPSCSAPCHDATLCAEQVPPLWHGFGAHAEQCLTHSDSFAKVPFSSLPPFDNTISQALAPGIEGHEKRTLSLSGLWARFTISPNHAHGLAVAVAVATAGRPRLLLSLLMAVVVAVALVAGGSGSSCGESPFLQVPSPWLPCSLYHVAAGEESEYCFPGRSQLAVETIPSLGLTLPGQQVNDPSGEKDPF